MLNVPEAVNCTEHAGLLSSGMSSALVGKLFQTLRRDMSPLSLTVQVP